MTDDNTIELTPFRADLARALARRGERLLAATDLAGEVAALEPLEAYYIVKEIGLELALPILRELSPEQLEACIDLDCWHRSDFGLESLDQWLKTFAQSGPETLAQGFFDLDYVVQLLFLSQTVTVYDPDTDEVPPEDQASDTPRVTTPDGFFLLDLKTEIPLKIHPYLLLDALYKYDAIAAHQLLRQVRVDLPIQIEEEALRFRNGRMEDLGFAPPNEAAILFSNPPKRPPATSREPLDNHLIRIPSLYASPLSQTTLLKRTLSQITDQDVLIRLEQELVWTINSAIIAYGEPTQDISQITDVAERVRDTISLGLESLIAGQEGNCPPTSPAAPARAAHLLDVWSMTDLFRHGFAATGVLRKALRQALLEPEFLAWANLGDTDQSDEPGDRLERAFVAALRATHPLHGGFDLADAERSRGFASLSEIKEAQDRLQRLVARICS